MIVVNNDKKLVSNDEPTAVAQPAQCVHPADAWGRITAPGQGLILALLDGGMTVLQSRRRQVLLPCSVLWLPAGDWEWEADAARAVFAPVLAGSPTPAPAPAVHLLDETSAALLVEGFFEPDAGVTAAEQARLLELLAWRLARQALAQLPAAAPAAGPGTGAARTAPAESPVELARATMRARLDEPLSLAILAEAAGVSARRLLYLFKRDLQRSPMQVLMDLRMQRASRYLQETDLTVRQIASSVGYADLASFSHAFSRYVGQSPSAYRDAMKWLL